MSIKQNISLSVVVPSYNSASYIKLSLLNILDVLDKSGISYELIIVDDGSKDETLTSCLEVQKMNTNVVVVSCLNNEGQRNATCLGFLKAKGKYVVSFDDDLQYNPNDIIKIYNKILASNDWVVSCYYSTKKISKAYYDIRNLILFCINHVFFINYKNSKYFSSFKIFNKDALVSNQIHNIYYFWKIPPQKIAVIKIDKGSRISGVSNYKLNNYLKMLSHVLIKIYLKINAMILLVTLLLSLINYNHIKYFVVACIVYLIASIYLFFEVNAYKKTKITLYEIS